MPFDFDRLVSGSEYALFLALDGRREESITLVREILERAGSSELSGRFRIRSIAIAKALSALAEAINGRATHANRIIRGVRANGDSVIALTASTVENVLARLRHRGESGADRVMDGIEKLAKLGYADVAKLLGAVDRVLSFGEAASFRHADLTPSEIDVLKLLDEGLIPKEIAERTERSVYTVRVHIANIIAKLGCHGRSEAIRKAQREGLI
jgi:DNA-binding NarL/FixJ family response regulator